MATKTLTISVDGSPTAVTLENEAGTWGLKRNDTDAVLVASGTDWTDNGDDTYSYTFTLPVRGLSYDFAVKVVEQSGKTTYGIKTYEDKAYVITETSIKTALGIDSADTEYDTEIQELIDIAVGMSQTYTQRKFLTQNITEKKDTLGKYVEGIGIVIRPQWSSLVSVESITYVDTDGNTQTLASDQYQVVTSTVPGMILPAYNVTWPSVRNIKEAVTLSYAAGYGTDYADLAAEARQGVKVAVANMFRDKETGGLSEAAKSILHPIRVITV